MALKTHTTVQEVKQKGTQQMEATMEELAKVTAENGASAAGSGAKGPPQPPLRGIPGFFSAFAKEVRKDIMGTK